MRYLDQVSRAMTAAIDPGESVTRLAEVVVPRLCDWAIAVLMGEDGRPSIEGRAHRDPDRRLDVDAYRDGRLPAPATGPLVTVLLTGEPVQLAPLDDAVIAPTLATDEVRAAWRRLETTSATLVPLRARGETFGALALMNTGTRPPHTPAGIATAVAVARRGAMSVDNARLYGRQLRVAETLQHSLLTSPPPLGADLQIAVRYRPAASHAAVGGDWYDCFQQSDGALKLVIGDVVGHSVEAAAVMSQLRSMLRALAVDRPGSPALTFSRLDRVLTGLQIGSMATALIARVEPPTGTGGQRQLRWSSAGHPAPVLLRADGTVQVLDAPPERLLDSGWTGPRSDHEETLRPGDTVVLLTDGLLEHDICDLDEGMARVAGVLAELGQLSVEELCDELLDRIAAGRSADDIAVLALRCSSNPEG